MDIGAVEWGGKHGKKGGKDDGEKGGRPSKGKDGGKKNPGKEKAKGGKPGTGKGKENKGGAGKDGKPSGRDGGCFTFGAQGHVAKERPRRIMAVTEKGPAVGAAGEIGVVVGFGDDDQWVIGDIVGACDDSASELKMR